jgi:hypothetical protein
MPDINVTIETTPPPTLNVFTALLPTQTGNAGKLLATNGSTASWTNEPSLKSLRLADGVYPYLQLTNDGAPTDKKKMHAFVDTTGTIGLARVSDAENAATNLIAWDASNNTTLSGTLTVGGSIRNVQGTLKGAGDNSAWSIVAGSSDPGVATSGAWISLYGGTAAGYPGLLVFGCNGGNTGAITNAGNWGVGTVSPQARLHVAGGSVRVENGGGYQFTDTAGTNPNFTCQSDNNFVFYGTKTDGTPKAIFSCFMRSSTSQPLQFSAPVKIGGNGGAIGSILTAGFYHQPGAIAANGGSQFLDVTLTGADSNTVCFVECNGGMNVNAIILKANVISGNVVRVYWINPTPSSVSLTGQNYRVCAVTFI